MSDGTTVSLATFIAGLLIGCLTTVAAFKSKVEVYGERIKHIASKVDELVSKVDILQAHAFGGGG